MYDFQIAGTGQSPPAKTEPETADGHGGETRKKGAGWRRVKQKRCFFHRPKRRSPRLVSLPGQRPISSQAPAPHHAEWGRFNDCKEIPVGFLGSPDGNPIPPPVRDSLNCGESPQSCIQGLPDLEYSHSHSIKSSTTCIRSYCTQTAYIHNHRYPLIHLHRQLKFPFLALS